MSKEGDRASVLRTTTVRTKLRGDGSWLQPQDKPVAETLEEEKPWLDEVRARRLNGAPIETSPVSSPVETTPPPVKTDTESKPATQGFLIRGVFTKLENPVSSPSYNDNIKPKTFNKKPSEKYKQIAPHTVRNTSENAEGLLSPEEQEKRKEAAISVMKQKAARRSYVLSAAKRYEAIDTPPDSAVTSSSASFVAKRVEIVDEDESGVNPEPATAVTPSPAVLPTSTPPAPAPTPGPAVNATEKTTDKLVVSEPVSLKATKVTSESPKEEPLSQSGTEKEEIEDEKTISNDVTVAEEPQPEAETPLVKLLPAVETSPVQKSVSSGSYALAPVAELMVKTTPEPQSEPDADHKAEPEPEPIPIQFESKPSAEPSSNMYTLAALSDTLLSFNTHPCSAENGDQELATEEGGLGDSPTPEDSVEQEPVPELRDGEPITGDLLGFSDGPEEPAEPVPSSPGLWSQDLLGGLGSESNPAKTSDTLDVRANDVVPVNKEARSLSMQQQQHVEEKQTDETSMETQSQEDNADPWSSQQTTSDDEERSTDLYTPSKMWKEPTVFGVQYASGEEDVEDVEDEVEMDIQNDPELATDDSEQPLMTTWETPQQKNTEESQEATTEDKSEDQQTVIMFERKSTENESPWNRWTTPTVYIISTASGEEDVEDEDEEEILVDKVTERIEKRRDTSVPQLLENTSVAVVDDVRRDPSPEPEIKKPFVYVKEYIDTSEMSLLNTWDTPNGSDDLASSSISYSYSSPYSNNRASLSSTCTSCGEQLGEGAKITMEHLNINCHLECFKCDVCSRPMGDILDSMSLHNKKVHCESCRSTVI